MLVSLNDFTKLTCIGAGSFGEVFLVKYKNDHMYAMKVLNKENIDIKKARTEYEILLESHHPFVTNLQFCFQTELNLYMVMQYCAGGNFYNILKKQKCFSEHETKFYGSCLLLALEYLHFKGIIHRDVKLENIIMHASGHIMLTDFDLSLSSDKIIHRCIVKKYSHEKGLCSEPNIVSDRQVGTSMYMAPEIVCGKTYGPMIDWWSYGILIYEMLYGISPFEGKNVYDTFNLIIQCHLEFPTLTPTNCKISSKLKNLIKNLLEYESDKRLGYTGGSTEIKDHPFFNKVEFQLLKNQIPPIIPIVELNFKNDVFDDVSDMINPDLLYDDNPWKVFKNIHN
jgi:protein-serine/threonine kinase